jgi:sterol desaturase/sphingolipid hydroxylase (fatty acid hydroxylase superfamily)
MAADRIKSFLSHILFPVLLGLPLLLWAYLFKSVGVDAGIALQIVYWINFAFLLTLEQIIPFESAWAKGDGQIKNDLFFSFSAVIINSAATVLVIWLMTWALSNMQALASLNVWPTQWPFAIQLVMGILLWDFGVFSAHYLAHKVPFLWRFHAVHHIAPRLSVINTGRLHPVDLAKTVMLGAPLPILLGVPVEISLWYASFNVFIGMLTHVNIDLKCGIFNQVFSTPNLHRWHHSPHVEETDTNFSEGTIFWDRVFGTYFNPARPPRRDVGLTSVRVSRKLWQAILHPLTPRGHNASDEDLIPRLAEGDAGARPGLALGGSRRAAAHR